MQVEIRYRPAFALAIVTLDAKEHIQKEDGERLEKQREIERKAASAGEHFELGKKYYREKNFEQAVEEFDISKLFYHSALYLQSQVMATDADAGPHPAATVVPAAVVIAETDAAVNLRVITGGEPGAGCQQ